MKVVNGQELCHRHELSDKVATHSADNSPTGIIQGFMNGVFGGLYQMDSAKFNEV